MARGQGHRYLDKPGWHLPERAFLRIDSSKPQEDDFPEILEVYTRTAADEPWRRTVTGLIEGGVAWPPSPGLIGPVPTIVNGLTLPRVTAFTDALSDPEAADERHFSKRDAFLYGPLWMDIVRENIKHLATTTVRFTPAADAFALPVQDSTVLIVPMTLIRRWTTEPGFGFSWGPPQDNLYTGSEYREARFRGDIVMAIRVPPQGPISVLGPPRATTIDTTTS